MDEIKKIIATFLYTGMSRYAPGTAGTLGAALCHFFIWKLSFSGFWVILSLLILSSIGTVWVGSWAESYFQTKDPGPVVLDEVAGYFLTVLLFKPSISVFVAGFLLFRIFDITKIYPIRKFERFKAGLGILLDDLAAAIYAGAALVIMSWLVSFLQLSIDIKPLFWSW